MELEEPLPRANGSVDRFCPIIDSTDLPPKESVAAYVIDMMAAVRVLVGVPDTFHELAMKLLHSFPKGYPRMDVVVDSYRENSIKNAERVQRGPSVRNTIKGPNSKVPSNFAEFSLMVKTRNTL